MNHNNVFERIIANYHYEIEDNSKRGGRGGGGMKNYVLTRLMKF